MRDAAAAARPGEAGERWPRGWAPHDLDRIDGDARRHVRRRAQLRQRDGLARQTPVAVDGGAAIELGGAHSERDGEARGQRRQLVARRRRIHEGDAVPFADAVGAVGARLEVVGRDGEGHVRHALRRDGRLPRHSDGRRAPRPHRRRDADGGRAAGGKGRRRRELGALAAGGSSRGIGISNASDVPDHGVASETASAKPRARTRTTIAPPSSLAPMVDSKRIVALPPRRAATSAAGTVQSWTLHSRESPRAAEGRPTSTSHSKESTVAPSGGRIRTCPAISRGPARPALSSSGSINTGSASVRLGGENVSALLPSYTDLRPATRRRLSARISSRSSCRRGLPSASPPGEPPSSSYPVSTPRSSHVLSP